MWGVLPVLPALPALPALWLRVCYFMPSVATVKRGQQGKGMGSTEKGVKKVGRARLPTFPVGMRRLREPPSEGDSMRE